MGCVFSLVQLRVLVLLFSAVFFFLVKNGGSKLGRVLIEKYFGGCVLRMVQLRTDSFFLFFFDTVKLRCVLFSC